MLVMLTLISCFLSPRMDPAPPKFLFRRHGVTKGPVADALFSSNDGPSLQAPAATIAITLAATFQVPTSPSNPIRSSLDPYVLTCAFVGWLAQARGNRDMSTSALHSASVTVARPLCDGPRVSV